MDRIETLFKEWLILAEAINEASEDEGKQAMPRLLEIEAAIMEAEPKTPDDLRRQICIAFDNNAADGTIESSFIRQVRRDLGLNERQGLTA